MTDAKKTVAKTPAKKAAAKPAAAKPAAVKTSAVKKAPTSTTARPRTAKVKVTPEQRHFMIAEAAYYRAERRGFEGGYEWQDWMDAEAEIERMISGK